MAPQTIQHHSTFDVNTVKFSDLRKNKMGGKVVYLSDEKSNNKLWVQFPKMRAPFGISEFVDQNSGKSSYSLDLSLDTDDGFCEKLRALDDLICKKVTENSAAWLGKKHNEAVVKDALYKPIVRDPSDPKYSPTVKLKIYVNADGTFSPETYTSNREKADLSALEKGQYITTIVEVNQVWVIDNKCGVSLRLMQAKLAPSNKLTKYAFQSDDDEDAGEDEFEDEEIVDC